MARNNTSLATKLTRATGLQLLLVAGSLSIFSYSVGRNSGFQQSEAHRTNLPVVRLSEQLSKKLSYPTIINGLNQEAITEDPLLLKDFDKLTRRFWRQLRSFPVDYINYGSTDGSFLGVEKRANGSLFQNEDSQRFGRGTLMVYPLDEQGQRLQREEAIPGMSANHEEAWYVDTVKAGKPTWSRIYAWEDAPETFSISYNTPIFNNKKQLLGVVGVDMVINKLSAWIMEAWREQDPGLALIVEGNGDLVASSKPGITFIKDGATTRRANIKEIKRSLAKRLGEELIRTKDKKLGSKNRAIAHGNPGIIHEANGHFLIKATPWGQEYGLNWYLLTATPADKEWGTLQRNQLLFLGISIAALAFSLLINRRLIRVLLVPLTALRQASLNTQKQIKTKANRGDLSSPLIYNCDLSPTKTSEVDDLNQAIQSMVEGFNRLTQALQEQDERELAAMSEKLKISLEAASIAHEINQPLSIVRLTSQSLLQNLADGDSTSLRADISKGLSTLNTETERISTISEKIRSLLRTAQTNFAPVDLLQVVEGSVRYVQSNHANGEWIDTTPLRALTDGQAVIEGDAVQLQLAVINLLRNAIDALSSHTTPVGSAPRVQMNLIDQGSCWGIEVDDNGPGMDTRLLEAGPLTSTKVEGSGLGLFIVRTTAENHGGQLELSPGECGGLMARLSLPKPQ